MKVSLQSLNYDIIDHGIVFLFDENSDLTFNIDAENGFNFKLILKFVNNIVSSKQVINRSVINNEIILECVNFSSSGTGTSIPLEIAKISGKRVYLIFWVYLEGDVIGQKKSKSVKYTLFIER